MVELLVVLVVTGILVAAFMLLLPPAINRTGDTVDIASVKLLDKATTLYKITHATTGNDVFQGITTDTARLGELYGTGNIDRIPIPNTKGISFAWSISKQKWSMVHVVTGSDVIWGSDLPSAWYYETIFTYTGDPANKDIVIPNIINGRLVKAIYQDVFNGKGLTSVVIPEGIERIHARAFQNNNLTEIVFPASINRIDLLSFAGNNLLTKITIGQGVYVENTAFPFHASFVAAYGTSGTAGTYILTGGNWIRQ